tara:strand:+ start:761 stop:1879 length:1119 start_codon:yes stop_codon:yes gene_type:complete
MSSHINIAVDAMGGDFGPPVTIPGLARALPHLLRKSDEVTFHVYGRESEIKAELVKIKGKLREHIKIHHTDDIVAPDEKPSSALRNRKTSSMALAIQAVKEGMADCVISAGNTGALMAMAKLALKPLPEINRPAIASVFPTMKNPTLMLDLGANIQCSGANLAQFAVLGAVYARLVMKVENPQVGVLNVGSEETKGHEEVRMAAEILSNARQFPGEYYGFVEGNDIAQGTVDVIVTDGFTGNIALKTAEGVGKMSRQFIRDAFQSSLMAKIGLMFAGRAMLKVKKRLDPRDYNGGLFLGLQGICVKSHGGTDAYGFSRAIEVGARMARNDYTQEAARETAKLMDQDIFSKEGGQAEAPVSSTPLKDKKAGTK